MFASRTNFIEKKGCVPTASNLRPLTIPNTLHRLVGKLISDQLQPFLARNLHPSQSAFVRQRCFTDNVDQGLLASISTLREGCPKVVPLLCAFQPRSGPTHPYLLSHPPEAVPISVCRRSSLPPSATPI